MIVYITNSEMEKLKPLCEEIKAGNPPYFYHADLKFIADIVDRATASNGMTDADFRKFLCEG